MSAMWEVLFKEEKQDWATWIMAAIHISIDFLLELPFTLMGLLSMSFGMVYEFIVAQALVIADVLELGSWWGIEHTVFTLVLIVDGIFILKRRRGDWYDILCQFNAVMYGLATFGSFMWMVSGLQGGTLFDGKLSHPSVAVYALSLQMARVLMEVMDKEVYGYGYQQAPKDGPSASVHSYLSNILCMEISLLLTVATLGLPSFESEDLLQWLTIFPAVAIAQKASNYFKSELPDTIAPVSVNNGDAVKMSEGSVEAVQPEVAAEEAEEGKEEPEKVVEEEKQEPEPSGDKEKTEEASGEKAESEDSAEKTEDIPVSEDAETKAEPSKASSFCVACTKVCDFAKDLCTRMVDALLKCISLILGLPWEAIVRVTASLGTGLANVYVFWILTENPIVFALPLTCALIPVLAEKARGRDWLSDRGAHAAREGCMLATAATQYYLFRTYITI